MKQSRHEKTSVVHPGSGPDPRGSVCDSPCERPEASLPDSVGLQYEIAYSDWQAARVIGDLKATVGEVMAALRRR